MALFVLSGPDSLRNVSQSLRWLLVPSRLLRHLLDAVAGLLSVTIAAVCPCWDHCSVRCSPSNTSVWFVACDIALMAWFCSRLSHSHLGLRRLKTHLFSQDNYAMAQVSFLSSCLLHLSNTLFLSLQVLHQVICCFDSTFEVIFHRGGR